MPIMRERQRTTTGSAMPAPSDAPAATIPLPSTESTASTPRLQALDVTKRFYTRGGLVEALGPVSVDVEDGSFVCLVGPSGCGKSTLLRLFAGLLPPSSGSVRMTVDQSTRNPSAMVFQDYAIYPWKTVLANVRVGLDLNRVPKKEANRTARRWIEKLGLADFENKLPSELSGGMRQRVSIARALAVDPDVLFMDEPFAALDAQLRTILQDELLALWQENRRTVVFVTHSLEEAILLGDRVIVMSSRPGTVVGDFHIPFDRPRAPELRGTAEFADLQQTIWSLLRDEVNRSIAGASS